MNVQDRVICSPEVEQIVLRQAMKYVGHMKQYVSVRQYVDLAFAETQAETVEALLNALNFENIGLCQMFKDLIESFGDTYRLDAPTAYAWATPDMGIFFELSFPGNSSNLLSWAIYHKGTLIYEEKKVKDFELGMYQFIATSIEYLKVKVEDLTGIPG